MPEKKTIQRARADKRAGKAPSTQAGEFVREEIGHVREGKHGVKSAKQAIAIGLSKARRAGVEVPPPKKGTASAKTRRKAERHLSRGQEKSDGRISAKVVSPQRSRATTKALKREGTEGVSHKALSRQTRTAAQHRTAVGRSMAAHKAVRTKGRTGLHAAAMKAAHTRAHHTSA